MSLIMPSTLVLKLLQTILPEVLIARTKQTMINGRPLLVLPPKTITYEAMHIKFHDIDLFVQ